MGLVTQWRRSGLAIALVLAGAVACSDHDDAQAHSPIGAAAGGEPGGDDASSGAGATAGGGAGGTEGGGLPLGGSSAGAAGVTGGGGGTGGSEPDRDGGMLPGPVDSGLTDAEVIEPTGEACLQGLGGFGQAGPFTFTTTEWPKENDIGLIKAWIPDVPEDCRVPMVHFANGTGASCSFYRSTLEQLASFGFLTLCFESTNTGDGTQCIDAVEMASERLPQLISGKIGFAGHDTGGQAAFMCLYRAEEERNEQHVLAGYAFTPTHGFGGSGLPLWTDAYSSIDAPSFMVSTEGGLVSEMSVGQAFMHMPPATELYQYKAVGAMDVPVAFEHMKESIVPWFRWKLLGDRGACEHIKALPDSESCNLVQAANAAECE